MNNYENIWMKRKGRVENILDWELVAIICSIAWERRQF